jgi:hypothetical protein
LYYRLKCRVDIRVFHGNPRRRIETLRDRIQDSDTLADADRELLIEFSNELDFRRSEYFDSRHLKLLSHLTILAGESQRYDQDVLPGEHLRLADTLEDKAVTGQLVRWIHTSDAINSEETNRDYRVALRMFGEHVTNGEGKPDSIDIVSGSTPKNYQPMPDPRRCSRGTTISNR